MKLAIYPFFALLASCSLQADEKQAATPAYVDEAPLPADWPKPGPYNEVSEKTYPAYRAAFATGGGETRAFWTLFSHIKKNDIPMTAPVEMPMKNDDGEMNQAGMAFLYQNVEVGKEGMDGKKVEVRDVPSAKALSYAWQGSDSKSNIAEARTKLKAELEKRGIEAKSFRLLGYNGPGTPRSKKTWELQALVD